MIDHEDAFIDRAFELGTVEGLRPEEVKQYMRYMADIDFRKIKLIKQLIMLSKCLFPGTCSCCL